MSRKQVVMKRASYREGVEWIAANDNAGDDSPRACGSNGEQQRAMIDAIAGYISTLLLADLFGAEPGRVATDIFRMRARMERHEPDGDQHGEAWLAKQPKASGRERGDDDGQEYGDPRDEMSDRLSR